MVKVVKVKVVKVKAHEIHEKAKKAGLQVVQNKCIYQEHAKLA